MTSAPLDPQGHERSLGQRILKGVFWTVASQLVMRLLGIVSTMILARLLMPEDFGLVALAALISSAIHLLSVMNFRLWLVRHPSPGRPHYDTVWTLSLLRSAITGLALCLLAHPAAAFFDEGRLVHVMTLLALVSLLQGATNVGAVDFQKHLDFDKDFGLRFGARLAAFVVTVALAFWWRDYRALVAGLITGAVASLVLSYLMHPYRPRWSMAHWREAFDFSKWLLVGDGWLFLYSRADDFILGKLGSASTLGIYTVAHEIASLASTELVMPIRRVLLPGYSKLLGDRKALKRGFVDGFSIILLVGLPAAAGLGVVADPLVRVALGEQWLESIPILQALAIYGMASVGSANVGPVLIALGRTRLIAVVNGVGFLLLVPPFTWAFTRHGVFGAALTVGIVNAILLLITIGMTLRALELSAYPLIKDGWRTVLSTAMMATAVVAIQNLLRSTDASSFIILASSVATGVIAYGAVALLLWLACGKPEGPEQTVSSYVRQQFE